MDQGTNKTTNVINQQHYWSGTRGGYVVRTGKWYMNEEDNRWWLRQHRRPRDQLPATWINNFQWFVGVNEHSEKHELERCGTVGERHMSCCGD